MTFAQKALDLLRRKHKLPRWVFFEEFAHPGDARRRVDAIALAVWPSDQGRGVAYEIKANRADFIRELDAPEKRAPFEDLEFWFVTPHGVVKRDEVPEGCGLMVIRSDGKLVRRKLAKQRRRRPAPEFLLGVARRLAQRLEEEDRNRLFEGVEITKEELHEKVRELVEQELELERYLLEQDQARVEDEKRWFRANRLALQELNFMAGKRGNERDSIDPEDLQRLVRDAAWNRLEGVLMPVREAHRTLEKLIEDWPEKGGGS